MLPIGTPACAPILNLGTPLSRSAGTTGIAGSTPLASFTDPRR